MSLITCLRQTVPALQPQLEAVQGAHTFEPMLCAAWKLGLSVAVLIVQEVVTARALAPTPPTLCPKCGKALQSKGFLKRQLRTMIGEVCWRRRGLRCPAGCPIGQIAPLDAALGLTPHQETSVGVQHLACLLAIFVPFETAARLLEQLTWVKVSPSAIWGWVQGVGQRAMERLQRELAQLAAGQTPPPETMAAATAAQPLLIGADGVMVPFRPNGGSPKGRTVWREVKVAILARLERHLTRRGEEVFRLGHRRLVAVLGDIDALSARLWLEALRQGVLATKVVAWVSDGGRGLWRVFTERLAGRATGILDFYHAAQNLWKAAKGLWDGRTTQARTWFVRMRHHLRHGEANVVFQELQTLLALNDLPASARETLQQVYNYLDKHRAHLDYEKFKELGLPLGSGMVESVCKWLIQQRFKGVGMRWGEDGFNHLLHLRLAWINGRFDALFLSEASPNV